MKTHSFKSIVLHILAICCFCSPFFLNKCGGEKKAEEAAIDSTAVATEAEVVADSTFQSTTIEPSNDSINDAIIFQMDSVELAKNDSIHRVESKEDKDELLSKYISREYPFFKPILIPEENVFTGLANVIDCLKHLSFFAGFITILLLSISLTIKIIEPIAKKSILLIEIICLILLMFAKLIGFDFDYLWGYWLTFSFVIALICYDIFILRNFKQMNLDIT